MDCCAWLVEAGLSEDCVCAKDSGAPTRSTPVLPTGETGAGKVGQPGWIFADERFRPSGIGVEAEKEKRFVCFDGMECQPHVRLTALYGVFLI